jgi:hypothetical protein
MAFCQLSGTDWSTKKFFLMNRSAFRVGALLG